MENNSNESNSFGVILFLLFLAWLFDFWPFTDGNFRPFDYEHDYNVYFYYPDSREAYLGRVKGINACRDLAEEWANAKNLSSNLDWEYICCSIRKDSSCYEKVQ